MNALDILIHLRRIARSINLESKQIEKEYGLSIPQLLCLEFLEKSQDYQSTQKEIRNY